jgi:hypothetical protein
MFHISRFEKAFVNIPFMRKIFPLERGQEIGVIGTSEIGRIWVPVNIGSYDRGFCSSVQYPSEPYVI